MCALFAGYDVQVGVSLDGDRAANDRHRRFSNGHSSFSQVRRALFNLVDPVDETMLTVPWRGDPRPAEAALHGAYAHLAVADRWRSRCRLAFGPEARDRYRMYRSWVEEGIETLRNSGSLTPHGERFVNGMRSAVDAWPDE